MRKGNADISALPIQCRQGFLAKKGLVQTRIKLSWRLRMPSLASNGLRKPFDFYPLHAGLSRLARMLEGNDSYWTKDEEPPKIFRFTWNH